MNIDLHGKNRAFIFADIHGREAAFQECLEIGGATDDDYIICAGDLIDRSPTGNIRLLKRFMENEEKRYILLSGNHEAMLKNALQRGDGFSVYGAYEEIIKDCSNREIVDIAYYLHQLPVQLEINGKYRIAHAEPFDNEMKVPKEQYYWGTNLYKTDQNLTYITGHVPNYRIRRELGLTNDAEHINDVYEYRDQVGRHLFIDCGAGYGKKLGCLVIDSEGNENIIYSNLC